MIRERWQRCSQDRRYCHDVTGYDMSLILHTLLWETCLASYIWWLQNDYKAFCISTVLFRSMLYNGALIWYESTLVHNVCQGCFITVGWSGVSFGPNEAVWSAEPVCSDGSVLCFQFMLTFALDSCLHFGQDFQKAAGTRPSAFSSPLSSLCTLHV